MNLWKKAFAWLGVTFFVLSIISLPGKKVQAASASFYLSPSSNQVTVGSTVTAKVMISADSAINAGEGSVSYSSDILNYQSVSTSGSVFSFWTVGPAGSATGVSFGGGLANPGYSGSSGTVLTITWIARSAGTATISVSGSKILANDGSGTNINTGGSGGTITVDASQAGAKATSLDLTTSVGSSSHPNQALWYNQKKADLSWSAKSAVGYSFVIDQSVSTTPSTALVSATSKSFDIPSDGLWYFHIRAKFDSGFGPVTSFKIQVDTSPPDPFKISINQEGGTTSPTPVITFDAKDLLSGIDHYEAIIDGEAADPISSGDKLASQKPGDHKVTIRAFDKAGNGRDSEGTYRIEGITPPDIISSDKIVGLLQGINFSGSSQPDDTIVIYLGKDEVARFKAIDYQVSEKDLGMAGYRVYAASNDKIYWRYTLNKQLMTGNYLFQISRIDKNGAESEPSETMKVAVVASTIQLAGRTFPMLWLVILLLIIIAVLSTAVVLLVKNVRRLRQSGGRFLGIPIGRAKKIIDKVEDKIATDIDQAIPSHDITSGTAKDVRKLLKEEVQEAAEEGKKELLDKS
jgi:hypothetical protein